MGDEYLRELAEMADTLVKAAAHRAPIEFVLKAAAEDYGTTTGRMKYALSFARSRGRVVIDYDAGTVEATRGD